MGRVVSSVELEGYLDKSCVQTSFQQCDSTERAPLFFAAIRRRVAGQRGSEEKLQVQASGRQRVRKTSSPTTSRTVVQREPTQNIHVNYKDAKRKHPPS